MKKALSKKDIIIILLVAASALIFFLMEIYTPNVPNESTLTNLTEPVQSNDLNSNAVDAKSQASTKPVETNVSQYMCGFAPDGVNGFIEEFSLPQDCSQPVGIAVDKTNKIWIAATLTGYLILFDPSQKKFIDAVKIPNWNTERYFGSMVWAMEFDASGNLWFVDQRNNAIWKYLPSNGKFEMYKIPTVGSYPSSIVFDTQGKLWFSEIFGKKIGLLDPVLAEDNTSKGITEYTIEGLDFETLGPVSLSNDKKKLWLTAVKYPEGGSILSFDIQSGTFSLHSSLKGSAVPVGIVEDTRGNLWINDHATNLFFSFDPVSKKIVKYSTSLPTSRNNTTTLPYWNLIRNDHLWFNEHEGNAIAYFDIENSTLVEFKIPTGSEKWGNTSNPLKFSVDNFGSVWFTEWTENKLGFLDNNKLKNLPIELRISETRIFLNRETLDEKSLQVYVIPKQVESNNRVVMTAAGSISPSGRLWNLTGEFNITEFRFPSSENPKEAMASPVEFIIKPTKDLLPGNYTLSIGARYADVTYSKMIELIVS